MKKMFCCCIFMCYCCCLFAVNGQNQTFDSLIKVLKNLSPAAKNDTTRCSVLNAIIENESDEKIWPIYNEQLLELAEKGVAGSTDSANKTFYLNHLAGALNNFGFLSQHQNDDTKALNYFERCLNIWERINDKQGVAVTLNNIGGIYVNRGDVPNALNYFNKSLKILEEIKDKKGTANALNNIGGIYDNIGDIPKALEYYHKGLKIYEENNYKEGVASALNNIAYIYEKQGDLKKALDYYTRSLKIFEEIKHKEGIASSLNNLGNIYYTQDDTARALVKYLKCLTIQEEINDRDGIARSLNNIGSVYKKKNDLEKAITYFQKSLKIREDINDKSDITQSLNNLALSMLQTGRTDLALDYAKRGLQIAKELGYPDNIEKMASTLKTLFKELGKYKEALEMQELEIQMRDSIINEGNIRKITQMEMQYLFEKKESAAKLEQAKKDAFANAEKRRQQFTIGFFLALSVFISIISVLIIRQNKLKSAQRAIKLEQQLLRTQMNPHFIFNSLIAIESYIYDKEPQKAGAYLSGFAQLMRQTLENSREEYISLDKEITILKNYLQLQQLRYENRFTYTINVSDELEELNFKIPPMLTQPFIENAIEHGFRDKTKPGEVDVNFKLENEMLVVEVIDNGAGIYHTEKQTEDKSHKSMALGITKERMEVLNKGSKNKIQLSIKELQNNQGEITGTGVYFTIPLKT